MDSEWTWGAVLLSLRIAFHLITAATLIGYRDHNRNKFFATSMAILLAGTSLGMGVKAWSRFDEMAAITDFPAVLFFGCICLLFAVNGGNVAQVFSRSYYHYSRLNPWSKR